MKLSLKIGVALSALATAMSTAYGQQVEQPGSPGAPAANAPAATPAPTPANTSAPAPATANSTDIVVTARRLDIARDALLPSLGANKYTIDSQALAAQPSGLERGFNDVLLDTPGVSQDQFGGYHVRNEHGNLQYRINGVIVPEPITGFGQVIDTRFADSISLITGALPAQYGYRTSGVVDIRSRTGQLDNSATASVYGGSYGLFQPSGTVQGSVGPVSGFGSFTLTQGDEGIENPREGRQVFHDHNDVSRAFVYLTDILSSNDRITGVFGFYEGRFQIPNTPGVATNYVLNGQSTFDSSQLNERQRENNYYGTVAFQHSNGDFDFQIAPFFRLSRTRFYPDQTGDLIFNGVSDQSRLSSDVAGVQVDGRYKLSNAHTLRYGLFFQDEVTHSNVTSLVFPVNDMGGQASDQPISIATAARKDGKLYGIYLQDEWSPLTGVTVNYGGRFDRVNAFTREQQFSPRISLVYKISDAAAVHLGYARNFTPPPQELVGTSTVALFTGTTKSSEVTTDDTVKAEREDLIDAGVNLTPLHGLTFTVDTYYKFKQNLIDEGQFGEAVVLSPFNYQRGYNYGIELGSTYRSGYLSLFGNVAVGVEKGNHIISSQFFFGQDELNYIATHYIFTDHNQTVTASAGASYGWHNPLGVLTSSVDALYGSGLRNGFVNSEHLPAYVQVNLGFSQAFNGSGFLKGFALRFDIVNVGDQSYQIRDGSGVGISAPSFGPRRGFFGGISKKF